MEVISDKDTHQELEFTRLFPLLANSSGIDFSLYKLPTLRRAVQKRMTALNIKTFVQYLDYLKKNKIEASDLAQSMLIRVTGFFRNPEVSQTLKKKVFPNFLKFKTLRVWVPGCCTGEEVYSLAIGIMDFCQANNIHPSLQIFGTDLSEKALSKARSGIYTKKEIQGVGSQYLSRYFTLNDEHYQVDKNLRSCCTFAKQNLVQDPPFSKLDLISCRNLLIYLQNPIQEKIIRIFHYAMNDNGFLVLGKSENISILYPTLFNLIDKNQSIYIKKDLTTNKKPSFRFNLPDLKMASIDLTSLPATNYEFDLSREFDRLLIERSGQAAVLINESLEMVQTRGDISPYFHIPSGKMTLNIIKMANEDLAIELKMMIEKVKKRPRLSQKTIEMNHNKVEIEVTPLHKNLHKEKYFLILLTSHKETSAPATENKSVQPQNKKIDYLKRELTLTKTWMQSVLEEHEATIQELKSTHEEVLSSNEELQSLNEELQTAKEELESTNEELTTVNEQLQNQMEEVRLSEERFRILIESVSDYAIFMLDPQGRIVTWNVGAERIKGYKPEEIIGSHFSKFYLPEDRGRTAKELRIAARTGVYREENWRIRKDGSKFWASVVITALKDKAGKLKGFAKVTRDMTERKQAEESIRQKEAYARSIVQTSNDAYISIDSKSIISEWNHMAQVIFGWKREEVLGKSLEDIIIPTRFRESHQKGMERFLKTGEGPVLNKTIELSALHRKGHEFPVELVLWPIKIESGFSFHAFIRDITERKKAEELLRDSFIELEERVKERTKELRLYSDELRRSNADLQQFAYIASHDLQEPLRMVSLYADLINQHCRERTDPKLKDYLDFLKDSAIRSQRLIKELLQYSQIGSKGQAFKMAAMEDVIKHVVSLLDITIKENKASIIYDKLPSICIDVFQIEQLFQNLITNAIKYHGQEPPKIHISAKKQNEEWVFSVKDNGIGIDQQYHHTIFVIFKRLHSSKDYPGTGIGLALCQKIVERHGGRIWVESKIGKGSTFFFTLPEEPLNENPNS